jgi:hypothetical protein
MKTSMLILFLVFWILFLLLNKLLGTRAFSDKKMTNALNAFIIAPMSLLGYVLHPVLIPRINNPTLLSIVLMMIIGIFAFVNLRMAKKLRS